MVLTMQNSKNVYSLHDNEIKVTIKLSTDFGDDEVLLTRDMSRDGIIFIPQKYPVEESDDYVIIGVAYKYNKTPNNDYGLIGYSYLTAIDRSFVTATIIESNIPMNKAKAFVEVNT